MSFDDHVAMEKYLTNGEATEIQVFYLTRNLYIIDGMAVETACSIVNIIFKIFGRGWGRGHGKCRSVPL